MKKILAVGLIAAGLVIGGSATAHAATASQYVTVLWSYPGYPDLTQPQPFVSSYAGADLHVFDATLAQGDSCGHPFQVDVYKVEVDGRSWETLKETGSLLYAHDGGFLAYDAGVGTPYRVITPEEYPCTPTTPSPEPSTSTTPSAEPSGAPSASPSTTPSAEPPVTPSAEPSSTPTPSASSVPTPSTSSTTSPSPSATASSTPTPTSSTSAVPAATASRTTELAYTGANPWPGIGAASVLIAAGIAVIVAKRVRRG